MILWIIFACLSVGSGVVIIRDGIQDREKYKTSTEFESSINIQYNIYRK